MEIITLLLLLFIAKVILDYYDRNYGDEIFKDRQKKLIKDIKANPEYYSEFK